MALDELPDLGDSDGMEPQNSIDGVAYTELLTVGEVAKRLGIHRNTARRWAEDKILGTVYRVGPRKDRRFRRQDIEDYLMRNTQQNGAGTPSPNSSHLQYP